MVMSHERHEKHEMDKSDHFPSAGKMIRDFNPSEFDGFMLAKAVEFDAFENKRQNEPADFHYGESATITRMDQS